MCIKVLNRVRYSTSSVNFQYPLFSLRSSSSCLRLLPRLPFTISFPPIFPPITWIRRQLLRNMWPIQLPFLLFTVYKVLPFPSVFVIFLNFSHDRSNWSSLSFTSTTFQNFPSISDPLSEVSKFQYHKKLCSTFITSLVCSSNWSPICWWKSSSSSPPPYSWISAFASAILGLTSRLHIATFVIMLPKQLKYTKFSSCYYDP